MSNNPSCDLVEHPSSLPEMQSSNEHTDKINSEHASPAPQVNAQTRSLHPLFPSSPSQQTSPPLLTKDIQTHSFHLSALYYSTFFFFLSLILLKIWRNHKSKGSKIPKKAQQNKSFFSLCLAIMNFSRLLICRCAEALTGPLTARLAFVWNPSQQLFTCLQFATSVHAVLLVQHFLSS